MKKMLKEIREDEMQKKKSETPPRWQIIERVASSASKVKHATLAVFKHDPHRKKMVEEIAEGKMQKKKSEAPLRRQIIEQIASSAKKVKHATFAVFKHSPCVGPIETEPSGSLLGIGLESSRRRSGQLCAQVVNAEKM